MTPLVGSLARATEPPAGLPAASAAPAPPPPATAPAYPPGYAPLPSPPPAASAAPYPYPYPYYPYPYPYPPGAASAAPYPPPAAGSAYPYPYPYPYPPAYAPPRPPAGPTETKRKVWYSNYIYAVDGISLSLLILGAALSDSQSDTGENLGKLGVAGYLLAAPIVHWTQGEVGSGFASFGLRMGLPTGGLLLGAATCIAADYRNNDRCVALVALGALAGIITAPLVDAKVFAYKEVTEKTGLRLAPVFNVTPRQASLGFGGSW